MRKALRGLAAAGVCSLTWACAVSMDDEEAYDDAVRSTEQELGSKTSIKHVWAFESSQVTCPSSHRFALSVNGGARDSGGVHDAYIDVYDGDPLGGHYETLFQVNNTQVICSDYNSPRRYSYYATDNDHTVDCPTDYVAIGGGGKCTDDYAFLTRNRPSPSGNGAEPRGWRATCSSGRVRTYANCVYKGGTRDWDDCKVRRTTFDNHLGRGTASCNSGELTVASGAYCGDGNGDHILQQGIFSGLKDIEVNCSDRDGTAYAICCPGVEAD